METKILTATDIPVAVEFLREGELVAFPTETVYGLGAVATDAAAVKKVYQAKGRPSDNPLIVTVSDAAMMRKYVAEVPEAAEKLIEKFWPGPLTILFKVKPGTLPDIVTGGLATVAIRNPKDQLTQDLISQLGLPIVGPSANTSTKPSPTSAQHVYHDLQGKIAAVLDHGETKIGLESTIIDLTTKQPIILRPGQISQQELAAALGQEVLLNSGKVADSQVPKAPGMKYRHYAPAAQVIIVDQPEDFAELKVDQETGVVALDKVLSKYNFVNTYSLGADLASASHNLFAALRYFDQKASINKIYVQGFQTGSLAPAYMNRLEKAAAGKHYR